MAILIANFLRQPRLSIAQNRERVDIDPKKSAGGKNMLVGPVINGVFPL